MIWFRLAPYIALLIAGGVIYILWKDGQHKAAETARVAAELSIAKKANEESQKAITQLQEQNKRDSVVQAQVQAELAAINDTIAANTQAVADLEKANADVAAYLSGIVPDDIGRLLDK